MGFLFPIVKCLVVAELQDVLGIEHFDPISSDGMVPTWETMYERRVEQVSSLSQSISLWLIIYGDPGGYGSTYF